ncbi:50S ribosomal protein L22 [bacterium]|nr:50S ribosomal protein L22 [bacterium]
MPEVVAKLRRLRIAPRKVRLVADLIRKKSVNEALAILDFTRKKAARPLKKLLNSAIANAKNNFQLDPSKLYISKITVDEGPKYKRWMPRARGRADLILKRTSHITLVLSEQGKSQVPKSDAQKNKK